MSELNVEEQAIIEKARNMASETSGIGGDENGPPPAPATPTTPNSGEEEWGPYPDYFMVTPPWGGSFGVEKGKILYFEEKEVFVKREGEFKKVKIPHQRDPVVETELEKTST